MTSLTGAGKTVATASRLLGVSITGNGAVQYLRRLQVRRSVLGLRTMTRER